MSLEDLKPFDRAVIGTEVVFYAGAEGYQRGTIIDGEYAGGDFLGYTVWVQLENVNYVRVNQHRDGRWEMIPVRLT